MGHNYFSSWFTALLMLVSQSLFAHDFEVDGIYYKVLSFEDKTVSVSFKGTSSDSYRDEYSGKVVIPASVTYGGPTYYVTSIENNAFSSCTGLTSIEISNSVTSIGNSAFSKCTGLTSIDIPNSVTSIGNYAFHGCTGLTSIEIPNNVTSIGYYAFQDCTGLTSIEIPNNVTSIGIFAFSGCTGLIRIKAKNGNRVYDSREDCNAIIETSTNTLIAGCKNTIIPNSVTSIGEGAFSGCKRLTRIEIPNNMTSIGDYAFTGCSGLTSIEIPNSVTSIGKSAFNIVKNVLYSGSATGSPWGALNVNGKVSGEFIYSDAAHTQLTAYVGTICDIKIPNIVTSIGNYAFYGCDSLTSIEIPNSVTNIGRSAFEGCTGKLTIHCNIDNASSAFYGWFYESKFNEVEIGDKVTNIGNYSFYNCTNLTSIEIPINVTSIGSFAFSGCTGKLIIHCNIGNASRSGYGWFQQSNFKEVEIGNEVTYIGNYAFQRCTSLTSIEIPNSVTSIGNHAFNDCTSLTSIEIPNSVTSIGNYAFSYCIGLTGIKIPNSVTSIGKSAFANCTGTLAVHCDIEDAENSDEGWFYGSKFSEVILGEAVNKVGKYAFYGLTSIKSLTIGGNVNRIGYYAFDNCTGLTSIYSNAVNPPACRDNAFHEDTKWDCPLYVPKESIDTYKAANVWKDFLTIQENLNISALESITTTDNDNAPLYDVQGTQVVAPSLNGLYIRNSKVVLLK